MTCCEKARAPKMLRSTPGLISSSVTSRKGFMMNGLLALKMAACRMAGGVSEAEQLGVGARVSSQGSHLDLVVGKLALDRSESVDD
jgi:hypothetical protein